MTQSTSTPGPLAPTPREVPHLTAMGDWYHNFDALGIRVPMRPNPAYKLNQLSKEPILLGYLQTAIAKAKTKSEDRPSVLELFCADGYYTCHARRMGAGKVIGIDLDQPTLDKANAMFEGLYGEKNTFLHADVFTYKPPAPVDVLMNCGGLYHVSDPKKLIADSRPRFGAKFMVLQSVVTVESEAENYFVSPAPGWPHGSRFTTAFLRKAILDAGWKILDAHFNRLEGNDRPCDQGSAYFLCQA